MIKTIKIPAINVRSASHLTGVCQYASLSTRMTLIYVDMLCVFFYFYRTYDFEDMSQGLQMLQHFYIFLSPQHFAGWTRQPRNKCSIPHYGSSTPGTVDAPKGLMHLKARNESAWVCIEFLGSSPSSHVFTMLLIYLTSTDSANKHVDKVTKWWFI